jgi:hypothetical protein
MQRPCRNGDAAANEWRRHVRLGSARPTAKPPNASTLRLFWLPSYHIFHLAKPFPLESHQAAVMDPHRHLGCPTNATVPPSLGILRPLPEHSRAHLRPGRKAPRGNTSKKPPKTGARPGGVRKRSDARSIVSQIDWEEWRPKLFELYIAQNLTAQQVETQIALHGLQVSSVSHFRRCHCRPK